MKARCVNYSGDRATVVLTPCWLTRLFGARERSVDLSRGSYSKWYTVATGREVDSYLPHGSLIRDALDFREVGSPSRWALGSGAQAVAP